jgi:CheY-like chemotaxis protein
MLTDTSSSVIAKTAAAARAAVSAQKVMIVNGSAEVFDILDTALDAGHYDVVFVESSDHAYSHIKRVQPHLIILCIRADDLAACHVLSMLKLDEETRSIPVLTYTTEEFDGDVEDEDDGDEAPDSQMFAPKPAVRMN